MASAVREPLYLIYLDAYHQGDEIFINELAQRLHKAPAGDPLCMVVHGSGEKVERTLESQGLFPERVDGVLDVSEPEHIRLVERAVRETNQKLVAAFTDEVVPTVGIQGVDRNVLQLDDEGAVTAHKVGWVEALLKQRVVPVVSALVNDADGKYVREVNAADAAIALAEAFETVDPTVVFFTTGTPPGLTDADGVKETVAVEALPDEGPVPEPAAVHRIVQAGLPALLTSLDGLFATDGPTGTRVDA